jgi:rsbT antagonist protein RsbS
MSEAEVSIIRVQGTLMVTLPADPDDPTVNSLQERVLEALERRPARGVVLDISAVDTLDSFFARMIAETCQMVALMGSPTVVAGMRPSVAITTTQLGMSLGGATTALDVERALLLLERQGGGRARR